MLGELAGSVVGTESISEGLGNGRAHAGVRDDIPSAVSSVLLDKASVTPDLRGHIVNDLRLFSAGGSFHVCLEVVGNQDTEAFVANVFLVALFAAVNL